MSNGLELYSFYDAVINSFDEKTVPPLDQNLANFIKPDHASEKTSPDYSNAKIMISSWIDFLRNLFKQASTEHLLTNLNNHINFIKALDISQRPAHLRYFKRICEKLFRFLITHRILVQNILEIEEDYKNYIFNMQIFQLKNNLSETVLFMLSRDFKIINETTESHIRELLNNLKMNKQEDTIAGVNELKAIQETIMTILQLDRKEKQTIIVRKLKKEFELINQFFSLVRQLSEMKNYYNSGTNITGFRMAYDYPFLDFLKTLSRWYQTGEPEYLASAEDVLKFIKSKKPFRKEDILFTDNLNLLLILSKEFQVLQEAQIRPVLLSLYQLQFQINMDYTRHPVFDFLNQFYNYYQGILSTFNDCFEFYLNQLVQPTITVIYKRKLFIYLVLIVKAWINRGLIFGELAERISVDLVQIKSRLQNQQLKKMGKFKPIEYQLDQNQLLDEYERGLSGQLLFALEDFDAWSEGKRFRRQLLQSSLRNHPRFQFADLLYRISQEIINDNDPADELTKMQTEMIHDYLTEIIEEKFKLLPELLQIFYGAFLIQTVNLAVEAGKIDENTRTSFFEKLSEYERNQYKQILIPLMNYSGSRIFSEDYEKEVSSLISLFNLTIPLFNN